MARMSMSEERTLACARQVHQPDQGTVLKGQVCIAQGWQLTETKKPFPFSRPSVIME